MHIILNVSVDITLGVRVWAMYNRSKVSLFFSDRSRTHYWGLEQRLAAFIFPLLIGEFIVECVRVSIKRRSLGLILLSLKWAIHYAVPAELPAGMEVISIRMALISSALFLGVAGCILSGNTK